MDFIRNKDNTSRKYEYDFLGFFDSPDIRKYNSNTEFHPAEQAVLIARSRKRTVEDKIWALQYLAENYPEEEFQRGSVKIGGYSEKEHGKFRDCILGTIEVWERLLKGRYDAVGYVYAAYLNEKESSEPLNKDTEKLPIWQYMKMVVYSVWRFAEKKPSDKQIPIALSFKCNHIIRFTVQNFTQSFQRKHGNAFIVTQVIDRSGVYAIFIDKGIRGDTLLFHCIP